VKNEFIGIAFFPTVVIEEILLFNLKWLPEHLVALWELFLLVKEFGEVSSPF